MNITIRAYDEHDIEEIIQIWNEVVEEGNSFPREELLTSKVGSTLFASQTYSAVAEDSDTGEIYGVYVLHPNGVGRGSHICNTCYAIRSEYRGLHIGEKLVLDSLKQARLHGFVGIQFNSVVATNIHARHLYERLGFAEVGRIPKGFRMKEGHFEDTCLYYRDL